jgi:hypothetical protein
MDKSEKRVAPQSDGASEARAARWRAGVQADIV